MRSTLVASVTALALALAGCGGDDAGRPTSGSTTSPPATATPSAPPVALSGTVDDRGTADLGGGTSLTFDLGDFYFEPTYVKAAPGAKLTLQLVNSGAASHTFTVDQPKVDVTVTAGGRGVAGFAAPATGAVAFYCTFHRAQGMQGAIYVTAGATAGATAGDDGGAYNQ